VLDYTAFPHILDVIISYSPWKSLLALRGASKETRDRIDKDLLGKYLIFTQIGTLQYGIKVTAPNGHEHPAFAMWSPEWNPGMEDDDDDDGMETQCVRSPKFATCKPSETETRFPLSCEGFLSGLSADPCLLPVLASSHSRFTTLRILSLWQLLLTALTWPRLFRIALSRVS
jgi:hypothetical protein